MHLRRLIALACVALPFAVAGCGGGSKEVKGTVTLDGSPVKGATVLFYPPGGGNVVASGVTDDAGVFKAVGPNKTAVPSGKYKVVVTKVESKFEAPTKTGDAKADADAIAAAMKKAGGATDPKTAATTAPAPPKNLLPAKYGSIEKTPLEASIPGDVKLELTTK